MLVATGDFQLIYRFDLGYKSSITLKIPLQFDGISISIYKLGPACISAVLKVAVTYPTVVMPL